MNDPVKIIDKACMSYIIDHQEEKKDCIYLWKIVKVVLSW